MPIDPRGCIVQVSDDVDPCCSVTFTGFCLADGTPIGIVIQEEEQIGWFNFFTGVFTPGPPPAGAKICPPGELFFPNSTVTSVPASVTSTTILVANNARRRFYIHNDSVSTMFIKLGVGASTTNFSIRLTSQMVHGSDYPVYSGLITAIWVSTDGFARVTEVT